MSWGVLHLYIPSLKRMINDKWGSIWFRTLDSVRSMYINRRLIMCKVGYLWLYGPGAYYRTFYIIWSRYKGPNPDRYMCVRACVVRMHACVYVRYVIQTFSKFRLRQKIISRGSNNAWWRHQMKTFPRYWPFVLGILRSPVNSTHKGRWRGALIFSLICAWTNGLVNSRNDGDLRRHRAHYDVSVMENSKWISAASKNFSHSSVTFTNSNKYATFSNAFCWTKLSYFY